MEAEMDRLIREANEKIARIPNHEPSTKEAVEALARAVAAIARYAKQGGEFVPSKEG